MCCDILFDKSFSKPSYIYIYIYIYIYVTGPDIYIYIYIYIYIVQHLDSHRSRDRYHTWVYFV